ncbi:MAG: hypothetical protein OQL09_05200, partial [Gammaproteobacteria bacterium]|nr:hypothetical protein [Gammaproteobacteria bacterium]
SGFMDMNNAIEISCSLTIKNILCEALKNYASQALQQDDILEQKARQDILKTVSNIEEHYSDRLHNIVINRSLTTECTEAINYHYDNIQKQLNACVNEQRRLMLKLLQDKSIKTIDLDKALSKDKIL